MLALKWLAQETKSEIKVFFFLVSQSIFLTCFMQHTLQPDTVDPTFDVYLLSITLHQKQTLLQSDH